MALPLFYEKELDPAAGVFTLSEETSRHCIQVLRMKAGDSFNLTDGNGHVVTATITEPDKWSTEVRLEHPVLQPPRKKKITMAVSLLKNAARFEWFLEKATELGVNGITPIICQRTERQHFRFDRLNSILVAAMLQSQQAWLPVLDSPVSFNDLVLHATHRQKLIAHCADEEKSALIKTTVTEEVLMLIGPEGDFSAAEISFALQAGFHPVSLGDTRLRTETAAIAAATLLVNL